MNEQDNIYFRCRKEAARHNDRLGSREGAAELLGLSVSTLANYELGITKIVPVDSVILMADLYQAPELRAHYCKHVCPLGAEMEIATSAGSIESIAVRMARLSKSGQLESITDELLEIAHDGRVSGDERARLERLADSLADIALLAQEMKLKAVER